MAREEILRLEAELSRATKVISELPSKEEIGEIIEGHFYKLRDKAGIIRGDELATAIHSRIRKE